MPPTPREQQCLDIIKIYHSKHGVFPTHLYIANKMNIKYRQQVSAMLKHLAEKKHIRSPRERVYTWG